MEWLLAENMPYVPVFHVDRVRLVHPAVRGWRHDKGLQPDWREILLDGAGSGVPMARLALGYQWERGQTGVFKSISNLRPRIPLPVG
jgi:hypothetical protein